MNQLHASLITRVRRLHHQQHLMRRNSGHLCQKDEQGDDVWFTDDGKCQVKEGRGVMRVLLLSLYRIVHNQPLLTVAVQQYSIV